MDYEKHRDMDSPTQPSAPYNIQHPPPYPGFNSPPPAGYYPYPSDMQSYPQTGYASPDSGFQFGQQQVVVMSPHQPVVMAPSPAYVPMTGAIVMSCFAFWCCGMLFGAIAFIIALVGESSSSKGDAAGAIKLRNASYGVSSAGIVIWVMFVILYFFAIRF